ncbi:Aldehyde reductase 1 [Rhizoctonia solani]|uniref:Aldehyde reductase 1 n=1 Tax=Rhizoctonia solani TaxID=456999 RepID=A0A0K6GAU7_9AGAM|nr:Aldehyde reductase 1 [Rhizoctonia solani]
MPFSTNPANPDVPEVALDTELSCTEVWKSMIQLRETGKVKSIGVSNFPVRILKTIIAETGVVPAVNQVEAHPLLLQDDLVEYCKEQNIHISAYAPLGNNLQGELRIIDHEVVKKLASELGKTPAQVLIAYGVKRGYSVLPKSVTESRIRSNFEDFELPDDAYNQLVELGRKHPLRYNIPVNFSPRCLEKRAFIDLPYDIFLEVARYLYPLDLIHLSRVNKLYRRVFMHLSSAGFWRATLINVGLPQCPDESFPEPKYAALIFLEQCTECQAPTDLHPDPVFLVRFCSRCQEKKTLTANTVEQPLRFLIPRSQYFEASLEGIRPYFHLREHYEEVAKEIRQLERSGDTTLLEAYKAKRAEFVWAWYQKTVPLVQWAVKQRAEHQAKLNILKEARIEGRLLKLGLELIDVRNCRHWCPQWASLVDTAKPFDEAVNWIEMLPSLFNSVELARKERLRTEAEQHRAGLQLSKCAVCGSLPPSIQKMGPINKDSLLAIYGLYDVELAPA